MKFCIFSVCWIYVLYAVTVWRILSGIQMLNHALIDSLTNLVLSSNPVNLNNGWVSCMEYTENINKWKNLLLRWKAHAVPCQFIELHHSVPVRWLEMSLDGRISTCGMNRKSGIYILAVQVVVLLLLVKSWGKTNGNALWQHYIMLWFLYLANSWHLEAH